MNTREAAPQDSRVLSQLFSPLYKAELKWSEAKIRENMINGENEYFLGLIENSVEGALSLVFDNASCELEALAVLHQRQGHGSELLKFAEETARQKECTRIWCYSLALYNAREFYEKNGWKQESFIADFFGGQDCYVYSREL